MTSPIDHDRFVDLLVARATEGLDAPERAELLELGSGTSQDELSAFDEAAALIDLVFMEEEEAPVLPAGLRSKLVAAAQLPGASSRATKPWMPSLLSWSGWALAAAATLLLVFGDGTASKETPTPAQRLTALVLESRDLLRVAWAPAGPEGPQAATGEVIWSDERQEGYMVFRGLPSNDPKQKQYQLWIVDPARDERPVDGGVFDVVPGGSEVVVPIDAKLAVRNPKAFVITAEQPGGVVVSKGPFLLIAKAP